MYALNWYFITYFSNTKRITTGSFLEVSYIILTFHIKKSGDGKNEVTEFLQVTLS